MARVTIDEEVWSDVFNIANRTGWGKSDVLGRIVELWHSSQRKSLLDITRDELIDFCELWNHSDDERLVFLDALLWKEIISLNEDGTYKVRGNQKHIDGINAKRVNGKKGGRPKKNSEPVEAEVKVIPKENILDFKNTGTTVKQKITDEAIIEIWNELNPERPFQGKNFGTKGLKNKFKNISKREEFNTLDKWRSLFLKSQESSWIKEKSIGLTWFLNFDNSIRAISGEFGSKESEKKESENVIRSSKIIQALNSGCQSLSDLPSELSLLSIEEEFIRSHGGINQLSRTPTYALSQLFKEAVL